MGIAQFRYDNANLPNCSVAIFQRQIRFVPVTIRFLRWKSGDQMEVVHSYARGKDTAYLYFNFPSGIPKNFAERFADMEVRGMTIHSSKGFIDTHVPKLIVQNSNSTLRIIEKGFDHFGFFSQGNPP